jgi:hypothetical protein
MRRWRVAGNGKARAAAGTPGAAIRTGASRGSIPARQMARVTAHRNSVRGGEALARRLFQIVKRNQSMMPKSGCRFSENIMLHQ